MTDEQINKRIALLCGWKIFSHWNNLWAPPRQVVEYECDAYPIPNYAGDLNACHEFAAWLNLEQQIKFAEELQCIILESPYRAWWDATAMEVFQIADATARQRCEAFLRVHNQWEEQL